MIDEKPLDDLLERAPALYERMKAARPGIRVGVMCPDLLADIKDFNREAERVCNLFSGNPKGNYILDS